MPKSTKYRSRKLSHLDRAQIRALTSAGYTDVAIGEFFGCNPRAVKRAQTNNLKGAHKEAPQKDSELLDTLFLTLVKERDSGKLAAHIGASVDSQMSQPSKLEPASRANKTQQESDGGESDVTDAREDGLDEGVSSEEEHLRPVATRIGPVRSSAR